MTPVRAEIIEAMRTLGPATIKEVAGLLSRAPASLYAHFTRLVSLGVLLEREPRRLTRHTESVFELAAHDFVPQFRRASDASIGDIATITAQGVVRSALRTLRAAARADQLSFGPDEANHGILHEVVWLNRSELAELRAALRSVKRLCGTRKTPHGRQPHLLIALYMPVVGASRRRSRASTAPKAAKARAQGARRARRLHPDES
ncbi:MAG: helix-turn-helix domain-containing protein [Phycisphaerales bacterium]|nr:helix-turn-helix domain-containing protein [Phycisphaerales bacterium]